METQTKNQNNDHSSGQQTAEQFTVASLLYMTSLIASGLALWPGTFIFSVLVICFWAICFVARQQSVSAKWIIIILVAIVILGALFPTIQVSRDAPHHLQCSNNMRQLGLSLLNYESTHGTFPEAAELRNGHLVSWRLAVCPYIELDRIYHAFNFSEPWDSPSNMQLANQTLQGFKCPSNLQPPKTPYKLVTGTGTVFDGKSPPAIAKISDGTGNTIILIEDHSDFVFWSEPKDIDIEQAITQICNLDPANAVHCSEGFFFDKRFGINVGFADGSVGVIGFDADPESLRRAFQCSDGKPLETENRTLGKIVYVTNWARIIAAAVYGFLILLPAWFLFKTEKTS